jgi:hypothetical protein
MASVGSLTTTDEIISDATPQPKKEQKTFHLKRLSDWLTAWAPSADSLLKVSAVLVAMLYLLGLIISNESLAKLGLSDFSLIRIKCILTGIWSLCLILIGSIPTLFVNFYITECEGQTTGLKIPKALFYYIVIMVVAVLIDATIVQLMSYGQVQWPHNEELYRHHIWLFVPGAIKLVASLNWYMPLLFLSPPKERRLTSLSLGFWLFSILLATDVIAVFIYPFIGPQWGGGRAIRACLVLNEDGSKLWRQLNEKGSFGPTFTTTEQVRLLYENDSTMAILDPSNKLVVLDKKMVAASLPAVIVDSSSDASTAGNATASGRK